MFIVIGIRAPDLRRGLGSVMQIDLPKPWRCSVEFRLPACCLMMRVRLRLPANQPGSQFMVNLCLWLLWLSSVQAAIQTNPWELISSTSRLS
jgi:hypothetical protein